MTRKSKALTEPPAKVVQAHAPNDMRGQLKHVAGSMSDPWNNVVANQAINTIWLGAKTEADQDKAIDGTIQAMVGIGPKDEIEGMLAAQLVATHNAAMECHRRASSQEQTFAGRTFYLTQAGKQSRTFVTLAEALNRHRGKGQQKVTVEHVHVHPGGQAVVGNVTGGRGMTAGIEPTP